MGQLLASAYSWGRRAIQEAASDTSTAMNERDLLCNSKRMGALWLASGTGTQYPIG
jgi:hypothetical protein